MHDREQLNPRDQIVNIMDRIYRQGLTSLSGGNISVLDENDTIWITPTAIDKGNLTPVDIVRFNAAGEYFGFQRPSSEYPFHWAIYKNRSDIRAIVHAHCPALIAFSIAGKVPETAISPIAMEVCKDIGFAAYASPGSQRLGELIAEAFKIGHDLVILENHGIVAGGPDLITAFQRMETLEYTARTLIYAVNLGAIKKIESPEIMQAWMHPKFESRYNPDLKNSQQILEIKQELIRIIQRAYQQHLLFSSSGCASMRIDNQRFIITPHQIDRMSLTADDLVVDGEMDQQTVHPPSRLAALHRAIYRQHADVNAILLSQPPFCTAFAVTGQMIDTRSIPESYMLLRTIQHVSLQDALEDPQKAAALISEESPALLIENLGILVTGKNILKTYDRLEVAEFSARSLVEAGALGGLKPINPQEIARLNWL
jgi:L-fuculose-phosphate aldolase